MGRAEADITKWITYFIEGMAISFENVLKHMLEISKKGFATKTHLLKLLDPKQRKVLALFQQMEKVTAKQVGEFFGFKPRTSAQLCKNWVEDGFFEVVDFSNKGRKYKLAKKYTSLADGR